MNYKDEEHSSTSKMVKFYPKRESALNISGIVMVLSFLDILGCGLVSCHSQLVDDTTDDFEYSNEHNYTSNHVFQNAENLSDEDYENFHDLDDTYNRYKHDHDYEWLILGVKNGYESHDVDKHRIAVIIGHIDGDNDGFVTLEEMKNWILINRLSIIAKSVERPGSKYDEDRNDQIGWAKYRQNVYGVLNDASKGENDHISQEDNESYSQAESVDKQRWDYADENEDGFLTKLEFRHYLYPNFENSFDLDMIVREAVIQEAIADMDVNGDGKVGLEEYIASINHEVPAGNYYKVKQFLIDWVKLASEKFYKERDLNRDGFLDKEEVHMWILGPKDYMVTLEAEDFIALCDRNSDGKVTVDEAVKTYLTIRNL